jgi:hypothetical protein
LKKIERVKKYKYEIFDGIKDDAENAGRSIGKSTRDE